MTSNNEEISNYTNGLTPGNLYIGSVKNSIPYSKEEHAVFDPRTYNFHLYPKEENIEDMQRICQDTERLRKGIIEQLKENENVSFVTNEKQFKQAKKNRDGRIFISQNAGKRGHLVPLYKTFYSYNNVNHMFRNIKACKNGIIYYLNFMRFFIDKNNKVNCIMNMFQYDCVLKGQNEIKYPTSYRSQSLHTLGEIIKNAENSNFYYNPQVLFDADNGKAVADSFIEFINICDENLEH